MNPKIITPEDINHRNLKWSYFKKDKLDDSFKLTTLNVLKSVLPKTEENLGKIIDHDSFEGLPDWKVSLSHTVDAGFVAAVSDPKIVGLGVDIESRSRKITPRAAKFFINEKDNATNISLIEFWTKKEAVFKAVSPHFKEVNLLKKVWVQGRNFGVLKQKKTIGDIFTIKTEEHILSIAYLRKLSKAF